MIRPAAGAATGSYSVVGDVIRDGVIGGEALLGLLPDGYAAVWTLSEENADRIPAYETSTMRITFDDPRLQYFADKRSQGTGFILGGCKNRLRRATPEIPRVKGVRLVISTSCRGRYQGRAGGTEVDTIN